MSEDWGFIQEQTLDGMNSGDNWFLGSYVHFLKR